MRIIAWIALVVVIGSFLCRSLADPDLWWHIVVGRWIVSNKTVPHVDYWNAFGVGQPWRAYSWSNELVYALVESRYKDTGLAILQLLLGCGFAFSIIAACCLLAGDSFIGALIGVITGVAVRSHFSLRPQTLVWILFVLAVLVADRVRRDGGVSGSRLLGVALLGCVWANTHISGVFGVFALIFWMLSAPVSPVGLAPSLKLATAFIIGTFISPYLGGEWLTLFSKSDHVFAFRSIDEFKPADLTQSSSQCVMFQLVFLTALSFASKRLPHLGGMLVGAVTVVIGAIAVKFMPFAAIALGLLTASWLSGVNWDRVMELSGGDRLLKGLALLRGFFLTRQAQTIGALSFFLICISWVNIAKLVKAPIDYGATPRRAVDFIEAHSLKHPVLNDFTSGGYLEYRWSAADGTPLHLVSIDGRTNVNKAEVWRGYSEAFRGGERWREYFDTVQPRTVIWKQGSPLVALLLESSEWCRVFETSKRANSYGVFIRREEFEQRRGEFTSSDCASSSEPVCKDLCGDGICQEIVCMAVGCPCAETAKSCPGDCGGSK